MKGLHFVFTWTTFFILFETHHDVTESCFHDNIQQRNVIERITKLLTWTSNGKVRKSKRHSDSVYIPLRIKTIYSFDYHLTQEEQDNLERVLERAVWKITRTLSVKRIDGPLLLARETACPISITKGVNKGKCGRIQKGYSGEYCMDNLKIPPEHLEGFAVYSKSSEEPKPRKIYFEDGPGLPNTDFVLYVTAKTTELCNPYKSSALAYAASCQMDITGRPVAGHVNFCPRTVKTQKFAEELFYKTSIHELFHALGFSSKSFKRFKKCDESGECQAWPRPMIRLVEGVMRLLTGAVIREMKAHFNCTTESDFGAPVDVSNGKVTSHWDQQLMQSSIMASKEQKPYVTLLDRISLAVLEDSGWYKVNYSQADHFIWGKGQGCSFGLEHSCRHQEGFCLDNAKVGCHHLHLSKARCNINSSISACGVFAADQKPCFLNSLAMSEKEELYSDSSRCFLSSLVPIHNASKVFPEVMGKCYERRCEDNQYYVRIKDNAWHLCQPGSYIQIPDYNGSIQCPSFEKMCSHFTLPETPSVVTTTQRSQSSLTGDKSTLPILSFNLISTISQRLPVDASSITVLFNMTTDLENLSDHLCLGASSRHARNGDVSQMTVILIVAIVCHLFLDIHVFKN